MKKTTMCVGQKVLSTFCSLTRTRLSKTLFIYLFLIKNYHFLDNKKAKLWFIPEILIFAGDHELVRIGRIGRNREERQLGVVPRRIFHS
jgi:hypothetical protein